MSDWQPIKTAPLGGKWVLLWWPAVTDCAITGYRSGDDWYGFDGSYWPRLDGPTHWMPLPSPPQQKENADG